MKITDQQLNNKEKHPIPLSQRAGGVDHPDYVPPPPEAPPVPYVRGYEEKAVETPVENYRPVRRPVEAPPKSIKKPDVPLSLRAGNINNPDK